MRVGTTGQFAAQTLTYYPSSNLLQSVADGNGNTTTYFYDGLNRRSVQQWPTNRGAGAASSNPVSRQFTYDNLGRIVTATANGQTISYAYNALGEVVSASCGAGCAVTYNYDQAGRRIKMTWPDSFYVTYAYDLTNQLTSITDSHSNIVASFTYDNLGRRSTLTRGSGAVTTSYGYNGIFPSSLGIAFAGSPADNQTFGFTTNPAGQITQKTDSNQVFSAPAKTAGVLTYMPNALNEIATAGSATFGYDGHGNMTSNGTVTYNYDALDGVLTSSPGGSLTYDPLGRLATATSAGGSTSQFVYDGNHAIAEYSGGTATQHYVFGPGADEPLAWYTNGSTTTPQYLAADYRGSIIAVASSTGTVQSINYYDDYGAAPAGVSNTGRFQYTGQMWLPEVGLYHYKARAYSPALGRFLQNDPMGYSAGMNLYAYAGNDPINNVDPSGMIYLPSTLRGVYTTGDLDQYEGTTYTLRNDNGTPVREWDHERIDYRYDNGNILTVYRWVYEGGSSWGDFTSGSPMNLGNYGGGLAGANDFWNARGPLSSPGDWRTAGHILGIATMFTPIGEGGALVEGGAALANANKLNHVFGNADHALEALVEQFGGDLQAAYDAVQAAANTELAAGRLVIGPNGILPGAGNVLNINGTLVQLSGGRVMNGGVAIGSFSSVLRLW